MKKAYKAPISRTFDLQPEGCFLTGSDTGKSMTLNSSSIGASSGLSNKKSIWGSSSWSNTGD